MSSVFLDNNNSNTTGVDVTIRFDEYSETVYITVNRIDEVQETRTEFC